MSEIQIDGALLKDLIVSGYKNLKLNQKIVDELNVFPVPDGDTGSNMVKTMEGGYFAIKDLDEHNAGVVAKKCSDGMLLNARGNSGVILSQLMYGVSKSIGDKQTLALDDISAAFDCGVKQGYMAVDNPQEGTMLTVARESAEHVKTVLGKNSTLDEFVVGLLNACQESVNRTPEQLAILKESGVVDSGGAGIYYIFEGFKKCLRAEKIDYNLSAESTDDQPDYSKFNENSTLSYPYCSEVLLQLLRSKTDIDHFDLEKVREYLNSIGDSLVLVQTGSIIKVHVHTYTPDKLLSFCQQFGEFLKIKIENMTVQHSDAHIENHFQPKKQETQKKKPFGLVTVACGEGVIKMFQDFGADEVVSGGQTNNPSVEDFISAFDKTCADTIFVLPNNSNIYLTACQARDMYKASEIVVIDSKTIGDGYSAMSMLDYSSGDKDEIISTMLGEMARTSTGMVTRAIRSTTCNSVDILKDDYIALYGKKVVVSNRERIRTICDLLDDMMREPKDIATAIYGKNMTDNEKQFFMSYATSKYPLLEIYEMDGGQDVYDIYLIMS